MKKPKIKLLIPIVCLVGMILPMIYIEDLNLSLLISCPCAIIVGFTIDWLWK